MIGEKPDFNIQPTYFKTFKQESASKLEEAFKTQSDKLMELISSHEGKKEQNIEIIKVNESVKQDPCHLKNEIENKQLNKIQM